MDSFGRKKRHSRQSENDGSLGPPTSSPLSIRPPSQPAPPVVESKQSSSMTKQAANFSRPFSIDRSSSGPTAVSKLPQNLNRRSGTYSIPRTSTSHLPTEHLEPIEPDRTPSVSGASDASSNQQDLPHDRDSGVLSELQRLQLRSVISNKSTESGSRQGSVQKPPKAGFF
jgi:hypothetical protein